METSNKQKSNLVTLALIGLALFALVLLSPFLAFFMAFLAKVALVVCSIALGIFGALLGIFSALGGILLAAASIVWALFGAAIVALAELAIVIAIPALFIYWFYTAMSESRNWRRVAAD